MGSLLSSMTSGPAAKRLVGLVALFLLYRYIKRKLQNRPPTPLALPFIGNFYLAEPDKETSTPPMHKIMYKLSQKWATAVLGFWFGRQFTVVLSSPEAVHEALCTKGDSTAGRCVVESMDIITGGKGIALQGDMERWKKFRNALLRAVTAKRQGEKNEAIIRDECEDMVCHLRDGAGRDQHEGFELRLQTKRESINVLMRIVCGFRFGAEISQEFREVEGAIADIFERISAGNPSDYIPIAKHSAGSKKFVEELKAATAVRDRYIDAWVADHKKTLKPGGDARDFVDNMLINQAESGMTDEDIRSIVWDCMAGGIDTSAGSFEWLILILINHPEVQEKIHDELDRVVGPDQLPTFQHHAELKYLNAVICELFRYKHFAPFGIPHATQEDITIGGYNVPKNTQLMVNFYALNHDPRWWECPEDFRPERFLGKEKHLADNFLHPDMIRAKAKDDPSVFKYLPYGFGKRMCVGWGIGRVIMFMKAATHLHCFRWKAPPGQEIDTDTEFFGVTLVPRSQRVVVECRPAARLAARSTFGPVH